MTKQVQVFEGVGTDPNMPESIWVRVVVGDHAPYEGFIDIMSYNEVVNLSPLPVVSITMYKNGRPVYEFSVVTLDVQCRLKADRAFEVKQGLGWD